MKSKIKFHSIFYRYILFIVLLPIMLLYSISNTTVIDITFFDYTLTINEEWLKYIAIAISIISVGIFSFVNWKFYICKEGIYLRKIDLFVPWNDIVAVSHIWINECGRAGGANRFYYNRKTLVIYRKKYKPICIYNSSLFALYLAKLYNPEIKTNIISSTVATTFSLILNGLIFYVLWFKHLSNIKFDVFTVWVVMYAIKSLILPLLMVKCQNKLYGAYLSHDTVYKRNPSNVIHI